MKNNIINKIKKHLEEVIKIKTSPHSIALGFAIGTFIAISPTFGLGIFIGLFIIFIFKKISKISLLIALAIWNPLTLLAVHPINYKIGNFILSNAPVKTYSSEILNKLFVYSVRYFNNLVSLYSQKKYSKK